MNDSSPNQREQLFQRLRAQQNPPAPSLQSIRPRAPDVPLQLSFPQQRLWFLDQMGLSGAAYNIPLNVCLRGPLDVAALSRSLCEIAARHEVLRSCFTRQQGQPVQVVLPPPERLPVLDLSALPPPQRQRGLRQVQWRVNRRCFQLHAEHPVSSLLVRLGPLEHALIVVFHHIVCDGWSMPRYLRELTLHYRAFKNKAPPPLPPLPVQYADFALWQRAFLSGPERERLLGYWRTQLQDVSELQLPTDRPRPAVARFRGAGHRFQIPAALSKATQALAKRQKVTLFMLLLAVFMVLLHRYSGQPQITVGSPIANRNRRETEDLIGFFVNTLALSCPIDGRVSFLSLLERVREVALGAYAHQDLPFEMLVEDLQPQRELNRNPLFQIVFALQQSETLGTGFCLDELEVSPLPESRLSSRFDLELHLWPGPQGLLGLITYDTDLFDATTIQRLSAHYQQLLSALVHNPTQAVGVLDWLTPLERQALLDDSNGARQKVIQQPLHRLFEEQVRAHPERLALVADGCEYSYSCLNEQANQIAHYLLARGVQTETVIGLCLQRSARMLAAYLAISKTGACYLPLDPDYPAQRLAFMLADSQARLLLSETILQSSLPPLDIDLLDLDELSTELASQPRHDPRIAIHMDQVAYIIYTSGSTGQPKGIEGRHGITSNLIQWHQQQYHDGHLKTLQWAHFGFDIFFQELFTTWLASGVVYLAGVDSKKDFSALADVLEQHGIERLFMPYSPLRYLLEQDVLEQNSRLSALRKIFTAGEALQLTPPLRRWFEQHAHCRLYNHYGPTESYVVSAFRLSGAVKDWPYLPPVGRPVANVQIYLLDRYLQPVPAGVVGQIFIGGAQLARGYRARPGLTASAFLPDPFSAEPGARLYRTGDRGRRRADGNIEFLGRLDRQLKVRGYRIEPGEIEQALLQLPGVQQALVQATDDGQRLVAYVVSNDAATQAHWRAALQQTLPRFAIPTHILSLPAMPLLPTGKIDSKALPKPDMAAAAQREFIAPGSDWEHKLAGLYRELLGLEQISVTSSFFDLGGHSLLATQLVAGLRDRFGIELPLRHVFSAPSVAELARVLEQLENSHEQELTQLLDELEQMSEEATERALQESQRGGREE